MTISIVIGSYAMPAFIRLQIVALRRIFGEDAKILVSDDISQQSVEIRDVAQEYGVHHVCSETHRGHFASDLQSVVHGLAFARCNKSDLCLKVSQRLVLVEPVIREIIENYFADPNTNLILPGRIHPATIKRATSRFFSNFLLNSDVLCLKTEAISPHQLKERYENKIRENKSKHAALIEGLWSDLIDTHFNHHYEFAPELTHPFPGRDPLYLRKCQSEPADYSLLAEKLGLKNWPVPMLQEWNVLSTSYRPVPVFS